MASDDFAYVINPVEMAHLGYPPVWGALRERSGVREVAFFKNSTDKNDFVRHLHVAHSTAGEPTVLLSFGEEMTMISDILDHVPVWEERPPEVVTVTSSEDHVDNPGIDISEMPLPFSWIVDVTRTGVTVIPDGDSFDVVFDPLIVAHLGWKPGDHVGCGLDGTGTRIAIARVPEGALLSKSDDGGLETTTGIPFPSWIRSSCASTPFLPMIELHDRAIVFQVSAFDNSVSPKWRFRRHLTRLSDAFLLILSLSVLAAWLANRFAFHL